MKKHTSKDSNKKPYKGSLVTLSLRKEWKPYGLLAEDISINGKQLNHYVLTQKGEFVQMFSNLYHILPNQDVINLADKVAKRNGADFYSPLSEAGTSRRQRKRWFSNSTFGAEHSNVLSNVEGTRMVANYVFPEKQDMTGAGDFVQFGFGVRNGIDKMTAFSVHACSVRMVCDNIMLHLANVETHREGFYGGLKKLDETHELASQREKVVQAKQSFKKSGVRKLHFRGLTQEFVEEAMEHIHDQADLVTKRYKEMVDLKLATVQAEELFKRMPKAVTDDIPYLQGIYEKKDGRKLLVKVNILDRKDPSGKEKPTHPLLWDVFNDITNTLTYSRKRSWNTSLDSFKHLDRILVQV